MSWLHRLRGWKRLGSLAGGCAVALGLLGTAVPGLAQKPQARLKTALTEGDRTAFPAAHSLAASHAADGGAVPGSLELTSMRLDFKRSDAQEADLQALLAAQQNTSSPSYHQWLSPDEFAARFGVAEDDLQKVEAWLNGEGFSVQGVSRSRNSISFSGTAAAVANAFGTSLHYISGQTTADGRKLFAPEGDLSLPSALAGITAGVRNLDNIRPRPHSRAVTAKPAFTSYLSGAHVLTPADVATIYDIKSLYSSGYTGTGQTIAIMGQSAILTSDITNFQNAAGLTVKAPTLVLVPNTGASTTYADGDEGEGDLDVEYAGGIATGAQILFVYTGNSNNNGVFDALTYTVDEKLASIINFSFGECETELTSSTVSPYEQLLEQAASQGQTVVVSAGDSGVEGCYGDTDLSTTQQTAVKVNYPASSAYVTAMGGTQSPSSVVAASTSATAYWSGASGSDTISSALQYLPEIVWNESTAEGEPAAGGGGTSSLIARPSWQTGVTGIASGSYRLVPDISLQSSIEDPGYLICTSDSYFEVTGSCSNGFRASDGKTLTEAGGTSFAAPIFSGMVAILNQVKDSTGQGLVDTTLYTLAANSTTYASAFHDITSGENNCPLSSTTYCSTAAASIYAATTGYDEATGLGSIDLANLISAWPTGTTTTSTLASSTTTLSAATTTPTAGASDAIAIAVTSASSSVTTTPTGTVSITVDGGTATSLTLSSGAASFTFPASSSTAGSHTIVATYSGDSTYASSTATLVLTVTSTTSSTLTTSSLTLKPVTTTPTAGTADAIAITVASASTSVTTTPTGTVSISVDGGTATTVTLVSGAASYTFPASSATTGSHTVAATYSGDSTFASSTAKITLTVGSTTTGSFSLTATNVTIATGGTGTSTVTVTPASGYTGTVGFAVSSSASIADVCYSASDATVTGTSAATTTLTFGPCSSTTFSRSGAAMRRLGVQTKADNSLGNRSGGSLALALAGFGFGFLGWRSRRSLLLRSVACFGLLGVLALGASGCGSNSTGASSSSSTNAVTYTLTVTGTDTTTSSLTATTTMTLTID